MAGAASKTGLQRRPVREVIGWSVFESGRLRDVVPDAKHVGQNGLSSDKTCREEGTVATQVDDRSRPDRLGKASLGAGQGSPRHMPSLWLTPSAKGE